MPTLDESVITIIGAAVLIVIIVILAIYTWFKLKKDYDRYILTRASLLSEASADPPADGANGADGLSAYEQYVATNPMPLLSEMDWEAQFVGTDGTHGMNAAPAVDGDRGSDGSDGDIGDFGAAGETGEDGETGAQGVEGDTFITFTSTDGTNYNPFGLTLPTSTIGDPSPTDHPTCAFINDSMDNTKNLYYFYKGILQLSTALNSTTQAMGNNIYYSLIIYDANYKIIGFTEPLEFRNSDITMAIIPSGLATNSDTYIRAVLSLNRGLTLSSFTPCITDPTLKDERFVFTRPNETDPFIQKFYDIIDNNPTLEVDPFQFNEKVVISKALLNNIEQIRIATTTTML